jgi:dihydrofolate synthase/folylpolyglutamate synthase
MESQKAVNSVLERLYTLHPKRIDLSLERIERLLATLGNPERKLPPVFHVAGTNGKGSVCAILRAILEAAGYRVHAYTSPHLTRFNERIRLAGGLIENDALIEVLEECEVANDSQPISFFEITTAAAFLAFSRRAADACILEVGLGGRLDATNVIEKPIVSVITPVHFDHISFLGRTLGEIAAEKAGIIKPHVPVIIGHQPASAKRVIIAKAMEADVPHFTCWQEWKIETEGKGSDRLIYSDKRGQLALPCPRLRGEHQVQNGGTAVAALRHQRRLRIPRAAYRAGFDWARWPARLQDISGAPIAMALPKGSRVFLDGGHNVAAAKALKHYLVRQKEDDQNLYIVVGMMAEKDGKGFLGPFAGFATSLFAVPVPDQEGSQPPADLVGAAAFHGLEAQEAPNVRAALKIIGSTARADSPPMVIISGSLYLAGAVLKEIGLSPS